MQGKIDQALSGSIEASKKKSLMSDILFFRLTEILTLGIFLAGNDLNTVEGSTVQKSGIYVLTRRNHERCQQRSLWGAANHTMTVQGVAGCRRCCKPHDKRDA